jgi:hypothetical protein
LSHQKKKVERRLSKEGEEGTSHGPCGSIIYSQREREREKEKKKIISFYLMSTSTFFFCARGKKGDPLKMTTRRSPKMRHAAAAMAF